MTAAGGDDAAGRLGRWCPADCRRSGLPSLAASSSVLKFVPICSECVLGDDEIDAALYAGCKYEDFETRRDAVYGLLRRSTILALLCIGRRSDLLIADCCLPFARFLL